MFMWGLILSIQQEHRYFSVNPHITTEIWPCAYSWLVQWTRSAPATSMPPVCRCTGVFSIHFLEYFRYFASWIIVSKVLYNWFYLYPSQFVLIRVSLNTASTLTNIQWCFWTAYTLSVHYFLTDTAVRYRNITVTVRLWHESYYLCVCVCVRFLSDVYVMDCVCVSGPRFLCVCDNHWLSVVLYTGKSPLALIYYLHFPTACNFLQTDVKTDRQTDGPIAARIDSAFI